MSPLNQCFILVQFVDIAGCKSRLTDTLSVRLAALNLVTTILLLAIERFEISGYVPGHLGSAQAHLNRRSSGMVLVKL
jgi:hypothetical protein